MGIMLFLKTEEHRTNRSAAQLCESFPALFLSERRRVEFHQVLRGSPAGSQTKRSPNAAALPCFPANRCVLASTRTLRLVSGVSNGLLRELVGWNEREPSADVSELPHVLLTHNLRRKKSPLGRDSTSVVGSERHFLDTSCCLSPARPTAAQQDMKRD